MTVNPLVGTWRLISFTVRNPEGRVTYPFGEDADGFITYTTDGRMAVQFGASNRTRLAVPDWVAGDDTEIAAAARDYFAYCGTYEFHDEMVSHHVELSLMPNWMGVEQIRHVTLNGDTVTLSTPPTPVGGQHQTAILVWERVSRQM
jgi:hypothetical protein